MFNLSDKELDRLSREAASQHDPGDQLMGPGAWERLETRLDKELGGTAAPSPNPLRGIRRLPFQYAPVILLIVGVSYYAVRQFAKPKKAEGSGSPPLTVVKPDQPQDGQSNNDPFTKTPENSKNSTPTTEKNTTAQYPISSDPASAANPAQPTQPGLSGDAHGAGGKDAMANGAASKGPAGDHAGKDAAGNTAAANGGAGNGRAGNGAPSGSNSTTNPTAGLTPGDHPSVSPPASPAGSNAGRNGAPSGLSAGLGSKGYRPGTRNGRTGIPTGTANNDISSFETAGNHTSHTRAHRGGHHRPGSGQAPPVSGNPGANQDLADPDNPTGSTNPGQAGAAPGKDNVNKTGSAVRTERGTVTIQHPRSLTGGHARIDDSSLRAYVAPAAPPAPGRSLHINRSLQFGLQLAPDFSSVNSLAGDKPGSSIGITLDYQFVNRLYLSTGILFSKKNYTARVQDCHIPYDYFRQNNLHEVDFVKGSMNLLEIPLNLRYDFSVTGNTQFFASAGVSSYLMLNQRSDYYYNFFGREAYRRFSYPNKDAYLLSAVNLSLGVETGISNSLSLLVAPYVKVPTRSIGFGEIKMNSVGINFALKFAPVISRKRK